MMRCAVSPRNLHRNDVRPSLRRRLCRLSAVLLDQRRPLVSRLEQLLQPTCHFFKRDGRSRSVGAADNVLEEVSERFGVLDTLAGALALEW